MNPAETQYKLEAQAEVCHFDRFQINMSMHGTQKQDRHIVEIEQTYNRNRIEIDTQIHRTQIHRYIELDTWMHSYIDWQIHRLVDTYPYISIHNTYMHAYIQTDRHAYMQTHTHIYIYLSNACAFKYLNKWVCACIHECIDMNAHVYGCILYDVR